MRKIYFVANFSWNLGLCKWKNFSAERRAGYVFTSKTVLAAWNFAKSFDYPAAEKDSPSDEKLVEALKLADLPNLVEKLNVSDDWSRILSGGEQQRLAFARVILQKPDYIFLDEATSALDEPREIEMYELLKKILPNSTIISVGHRSTLYQVHDTELKLEGNGFWKTNEI